MKNAMEATHDCNRSLCLVCFFCATRMQVLPLDADEDDESILIADEEELSGDDDEDTDEAFAAILGLPPPSRVEADARPAESTASSSSSAAAASSSSDGKSKRKTVEEATFTFGDPAAAEKYMCPVCYETCVDAVECEAQGDATFT